MGFELIRKLGSFQLELPTEITSWLLLIIYTGLILLALWQWRRNFIEFNRLQWIFFVITIVLIFPANLFFILYRSGAGIPVASRTGVGVLPAIRVIYLVRLRVLLDDERYEELVAHVGPSELLHQTLADVYYDEVDDPSEAFLAALQNAVDESELGWLDLLHASLAVHRTPDDALARLTEFESWMESNRDEVEQSTSSELPKIGTKSLDDRYPSCRPCACCQLPAAN